MNCDTRMNFNFREIIYIYVHKVIMIAFSLSRLRFEVCFVYDGCKMRIDFWKCQNVIFEETLLSILEFQMRYATFWIFSIFFLFCFVLFCFGRGIVVGGGGNDRLVRLLIALNVKALTKNKKFISWLWRND